MAQPVSAELVPAARILWSHPLRDMSAGPMTGHASCDYRRVFMNCNSSGRTVGQGERPGPGWSVDMPTGRMAERRGKARVPVQGLFPDPEIYRTGRTRNLRLSWADGKFSRCRRAPETGVKDTLLGETR